MTRHYIIAGIVAGLCSAVAYRIGYADGRRPFKLDVQSYSSGKIIVYPTPMVMNYNGACDCIGPCKGTEEDARRCAELRGRQVYSTESILSTPTPMCRDFRFGVQCYDPAKGASLTPMPEGNPKWVYGKSLTPTPAPPRTVAKLKMRMGGWYQVSASCPADGLPTIEIEPWKEKP